MVDNEDSPRDESTVFVPLDATSVEAVHRMATALHELIGRLRTAPCDDDLGRAQHALAAVIDYLHGFGFARETVALQRLSAALDDLRRGLLSPMMKAVLGETAKHGRPPASLHKTCLMATASAAVTLLVEIGVTEPQSAAMVATALPDTDASTLHRWRKAMRAGHKGAEAREIYERAKRDARVAAPDDHGRTLLAVIADLR